MQPGSPHRPREMLHPPPGARVEGALTDGAGTVPLSRPLTDGLRTDHCALAAPSTPSVAGAGRTMLVEAAIMSKTYTHSTWRVKPGLEDEFVRRWEELADWSGLQGLTARAKLLRDTDDPSRFVSFGPWGGIDAVRRWRGAPGFRGRVARVQAGVGDWSRRARGLGR